MKFNTQEEMDEMQEIINCPVMIMVYAGSDGKFHNKYCMEFSDWRYSA